MSDLPPAILPTVTGLQGLQPIAPATLRQWLVALVSSTNPDYSSLLPGTLIEDIASTDVGALTLADQARIDLVNSVTPYGANDYLLLQLGQIYGVQLGEPTNTSVELIFTATDAGSNALPGVSIGRGFIISDGQYQYQITDGGVTGSDGTTGNLSAIATQTGIWGVPANTVVQLVTSPPPGVTLSVTNPLPGTPGTDQETYTAYRSRVLQAGLAASVGMGRYLRTLLDEVDGVQSRLIRVRQIVGVGYQVIVGGASDNYAVANAIWQSLFDIIDLVGSTLRVTNITKANPGVVTTDLNHNYVTGQQILINDIVGMTELNNFSLIATVTGNKTFSIGVDTSSFNAYVSGGIVTPSLRNVVVDINDFPDTYSIPFVLPPQQSIRVIMTWNTTETNFVNTAEIAQLGQPAIIAYINSIPAGYPFNALEAGNIFQNSIANVLPAQLLSRLVFSVSIDGTEVSPDAGSYLYEGDPESYLFADASSVIIQQG